MLIIIPNGRLKRRQAILETESETENWRIYGRLSAKVT